MFTRFIIKTQQNTTDRKIFMEKGQDNKDPMLPENQTYKFRYDYKKKLGIRYNTIPYNSNLDMSFFLSLNFTI